MCYFSPDIHSSIGLTATVDAEGFSWAARYKPLSLDLNLVTVDLVTGRRIFPDISRWWIEWKLGEQSNWHAVKSDKLVKLVTSLIKQVG
jgi:hypothetical protein